MNSCSLPRHRLPSFCSLRRRLPVGLRRLLVAAVLIIGLTPLVGAAQEKLAVTTSFSILADLVRQVGGEQVEVHSLVGINEDAHAFQPRPSDARRIGASALVVAHGLGFDDWLTRLARSSNFAGKVLVASAGVAGIAMHPAADAAQGHHHSEHVDPHAWQDVSNVRRYVANIRDALSALAPEHAAYFHHNAATYDAQLAQLDAELRRRFAELPPERRKVVSSHDAFAYFGKAYDVDFIAPVGVANSAEAGARAVASLILQLRRDRIPAVFIENVADPRLIERISSESGARIGGTLYSDALSGPEEPAASYVDMMRHNAATILDALTEP